MEDLSNADHFLYGIIQSFTEWSGRPQGSGSLIKFKLVKNDSPNPILMSICNSKENSNLCSSGSSVYLIDSILEEDYSLKNKLYAISIERSGIFYTIEYGGSTCQHCFSNIAFPESVMENESIKDISYGAGRFKFKLFLAQDDDSARLLYLNLVR